MTPGQACECTVFHPSESELLLIILSGVLTRSIAATIARVAQQPRSGLSLSWVHSSLL